MLPGLSGRTGNSGPQWRAIGIETGKTSQARISIRYPSFAPFSSDVNNSTTKRDTDFDYWLVLFIIAGPLIGYYFGKWLLIFWGAAAVFLAGRKWIDEIRIRRLLKPWSPWTREELLFVRSYRWGYFYGAFLLACSAILLLLLLKAGMDYQVRISGVVTSLSLVALLGSCGWFIIKRRKWACFLGTLIIPNPIFWIINACYFSRRWREFEIERSLKG